MLPLFDRILTYSDRLEVGTASGLWLPALQIDASG